MAVLYRSPRVVELLLTHGQPRLDLYLPIPPSFAKVLAASPVTADGTAEIRAIGDHDDDSSATVDNGALRPSPSDTPHRRLWRYYVEDERGDEDITAAFRAYCHMRDDSCAAKERSMRPDDALSQRAMDDESSTFLGYECRIV